MRCTATTKLGERCKHPARQGSDSCALHDSLAATRSSGNGATQTATARKPTIAKTLNGDMESPIDENPFAALADAMSAVADELAEAEKQIGGEPKAPRIPPHSGVSQAVYSAAYMIGFGVAFPFCLGMGLLPQSGPVARGLRDGARDAKENAAPTKKRPK